MSYINILTDDLFENIFNIRYDSIDNEINLLNKKLKSLKKNLLIIINRWRWRSIMYCLWYSKVWDIPLFT